MKKEYLDQSFYAQNNITLISRLPRYSIRYSLISFGILITILFIMLALICLRAVAAHNLQEGSGAFTDFDAFYTAGKMYWSGDLIHAYSPKYFFQSLASEANSSIFMPWTYSPQFNLITIILATVPRVLSYVMFMLLGMIVFIYFIYFIAKDFIVIPFVLVAPALFATLVGGQNSFITGVLLSIFCISAQLNKKVPLAAGVSLGLMIIKPHLALGLGWMLFLQRRWSVIFIVIVTIFLTSLLSTLMFGSGIWIAFLSALESSSNFLKQGAYPMDRMTSIYAHVFTLTGGNYTKAIIFHILFLSISLLVLWMAIAQDWDAARVLAISCMTTLAVSPYCYDYDTLITAISFSLVARDLVIFSSLLEKFLLIVFSWLMSGWGMLSTFWVRDWSELDGSLYSMGGLGLVGTTILLFKILWFSEMHESKFKHYNYK